jgi:hypothetical protein
MDEVKLLLDKPDYRWRASLMAEEFDGIDRQSESSGSSAKPRIWFAAKRSCGK